MITCVCMNANTDAACYRVRIARQSSLCGGIRSEQRSERVPNEVSSQALFALTIVVVTHKRVALLYTCLHTIQTDTYIHTCVHTYKLL